ncbi:Pheromone-regulated membrane protein 10 [Penicillium taxi]|uniref:Pheromone-regulated membrane protein 10 n=1 Tax=Penicillium taxi TaxID=168475 RepID=UPI002545581D|nr:Pheromone-regulated membrane protein 10 [Penicillium taxi]KAJ5894459.1 Pheromone-regulated membrane protein 10 [Penicillium taxi]
MPELEKAPSPPHSENSANDGSTTVNGDDSLHQQSTTQDTVTGLPRKSSIQATWRTASQRVRNRIATVAESLGRPSNDTGDGLDSSCSPEFYGATDDLKSYAARQAKDEEDAVGDGHHHTQAQLLLQQLGLPSSALKSTAESEPPSGATTGATTPFESGSSTPLNGGLLSNLLRAYADNMATGSRISVTSTETIADPEIETVPSIMPSTTPGSPNADSHPKKKEKVKWYSDSEGGSKLNLSNLNLKKVTDHKKKNNNSSDNLYTSALISASMGMGRVAMPGAKGPAPIKERKKEKRKSRKSFKLTKHIAAMLARQQYIMQLCRALMKYGAPTHRLEEYMMMTSNVLEINAQFMYIPGCMFMSFDDPLTRTAEVKIIRVIQGLDLSRLAETHNVYKNVVHDMIGAEGATIELDQIMQKKPRYNKWMLVILTGLASVAVGPYSFSARPIDLPIIFLLGSLVGFMQYILAPSSATYSNVLEVSAAILTSFLARAFGSIKHNGNHVFCFPAVAQSSIAMILPGFSVLSSSLELQSHQMNAGSIRMVFTIIYSLFLGYGVTVGTTIYGLMDGAATREQTCSTASLDVWQNQYIQHFPWVALFCMFAALTNQAKFKQLPITVFLGVCGYIANYFSTKRLGSQVGNTVGAFAIGLLANLYSRLWHGHAAAAIIPGILCLVPSGLASSGSIMAGLEYANAVVDHTVTTSTGTTSGSSLTSLGYGMIQTAIGISVGLFVSALIVYPSGKKRSGIFSL